MYRAEWACHGFLQANYPVWGAARDTAYENAGFLPELSVVVGEGPHFSKKEWCELVSQEGMPGALMASLIKGI